jgi:predicted transcriptional regulator of viral defense system
MKWDKFLSIVSQETVFSSALLLTLGEDPAAVRKQITRWVKAGKLIQLRRSLYTLAEPYGKMTPSAYLIANRLHKPSYVSLQSALAYHGLIPEYVPVVTSVTTTRPEEVITPLGRFIYRHCKRTFFSGFREIEVTPGQMALLATPEKAILDLVYLTPGGDQPAFLAELRLENLESLDLAALRQMAKESGSLKLSRAAKQVEELVSAEEYENL